MAGFGDRWNYRCRVKFVLSLCTGFLGLVLRPHAGGRAAPTITTQPYNTGAGRFTHPTQDARPHAAQPRSSEIPENITILPGRTEITLENSD